MKTIKNFLLSLQFILRPTYWYMQNTYSKMWDEQLNLLLDKHKFEENSHYTAILGGLEIWIENHPYASFSPYDIDIRPSRLTVLRANKRLGQDLLEKRLKI